MPSTTEPKLAEPCPLTERDQQRLRKDFAEWIGDDDPPPDAVAITIYIQTSFPLDLFRGVATVEQVATDSQLAEQWLKAQIGGWKDEPDVTTMIQKLDRLMESWESGNDGTAEIGRCIAALAPIRNFLAKQLNK